MLNLIVVANPDYHSFCSDMQGSGVFPVSRLFESTEESLKNKLQPLTTITYEFLQNLPVVFMTEPEFRRDEVTNEKGYFSLVRIANISNLTPIIINKENVLAFDFVITHDLGYQPLANEKNYTQALELGGYGLNRTFWAVKSITIDDFLHTLGLNIDLNNLPAAGAVQVPENVETFEIIDDVNDYLQAILRHPQGSDEEVFYRGHSDSSYQLEPSLFRTDKKGNYRYRQHESDMITELLTVQPAEFKDDRYMLDKLVRMQHFGLPTRLLDVSTNPLIALYFACSTVKYDKNNQEIDGNVIIMTSKKSDIKFFDSDTVSCIANLSRLPSRFKNALKTNLPITQFNVTPECAQLLHLIRDEKSYFKDIIDPSHLNKIVLVKGRISNARISSQAGAFLIFGENVNLPASGQSTLNITKLVIRNKTHLMEQLNRFGINESTVYPGIEQAAKEIAKKYDGLK